MDSRVAKLSALPIGRRGRILNIKTEGVARRRVLDFGMVKGSEIEAAIKSPSGDPVAYFIRGTLVALRKEDADNIEIII